MEFKLPENVRFSEECGLNLIFQEVNIRGSDKKLYQVLVTEHADIDVNDIYETSNWEDFKKEFPTLMDFLIELSHNEFWNSSWRQYDRIYFIESIIGHEGLYDVTETVWFDAQEKFGEEDSEEFS